MEFRVILNNLIKSGKATVGNTPKKINELLGGGNVEGVKAVVVNNDSGSTVYFSEDITADHSNAGGVIRDGESREFPRTTISNRLYFVAEADSDVRIEVWG